MPKYRDLPRIPLPERWPKRVQLAGALPNRGQPNLPHHRMGRVTMVDPELHHMENARYGPMTN
jgi:hypothetical protein